MLALTKDQKGVSAALVAALLGIAVLVIGAVYFVVSRPVPESVPKAIASALGNKYNRPAESIIVEDVTEAGIFAKGTVRFRDEQGGGIWFAAKTDAGWQLAYDGNGIIDCVAAEKFQFPTDMVPQCIDTANENQLVDRSAASDDTGGEERALIGGQTDGHGCLIAAGYSWCAPKEKCLRIWEEECYTDLAQEIQYMLADKYQKPADEVRVAVTNQVGEHASGSVRYGPLTSSAGGQFLAAKIDNVWQLVYDGNGSVDCVSLREQYGFPDEILKPNFCD